MVADWSIRFTKAALVHGALAALWSGLFIADEFGIPLNLARIVAGVSAGTWLTMGYILYLVAGVMGMAAWGGIYGTVSRSPKRTIYSDKLTLEHFILFNLSVIGVTWPMGYAGFIGGSLLLAGKAAEVHPTIVGFTLPIGISVAVGVISTLIGVINTYLSLTRETRD